MKFSIVIKIFDYNYSSKGNLSSLDWISHDFEKIRIGNNLLDWHWNSSNVCISFLQESTSKLTKAAT